MVTIFEWRAQVWSQEGSSALGLHMLAALSSPTLVLVAVFDLEAHAESCQLYTHRRIHPHTLQRGSPHFYYCSLLPLVITSPIHLPGTLTMSVRMHSLMFLIFS